MGLTPELGSDDICSIGSLQTNSSTFLDHSLSEYYLQFYLSRAAIDSGSIIHFNPVQHKNAAAQVEEATDKLLNNS